MFKINWVNNFLFLHHKNFDKKVPKIIPKSIMAKDFIIISIEEIATAKFNSVRLLDFMGKELNLNTKSSSAELYLNIEKIPVGVYILLIDVLHHNNILFTKPIKFIKT